MRRNRKHEYRGQNQHETFHQLVLLARVCASPIFSRPFPLALSSSQLH
jgi:hypothetical protein